MVKVHLNNTKHITIANVYIPPRDSTSTHYKTADKDIQHCIALTITLTTTQVQEAIQHSKNNNSVGPDNLSIRHLKHIGPLGLTFLTSMYTAALNKNIVPHMWKLANIIFQYPSQTKTQIWVLPIDPYHFSQ